MAFMPDEKHLLITNGHTIDVSVIDVASFGIVKSVEVDRRLWDVMVAVR